MNLALVYRLAISAGLILVGWLIYRLVHFFSLRNAARSRQHLLQFESGKKAIVYFTTPDCVACKAAQKPALTQLKEALGDSLQVIEIDAYEKPELAKEWGVLSVPTTFLFDEHGRTVNVNYGVAPYRKLIEQIRSSS